MQRKKVAQTGPTLQSHLAQGQHCGHSPEGELQYHEGGHPGPHHGQEQGQTGQVHCLQRGPLRSQPLLMGLPLGVTVGAEWGAGWEVGSQCPVLGGMPGSQPHS